MFPNYPKHLLGLLVAMVMSAASQGEGSRKSGTARCCDGGKGRKVRGCAAAGERSSVQKGTRRFSGVLFTLLLHGMQCKPLPRVSKINQSVINQSIRLGDLETLLAPTEDESYFRTTSSEQFEQRNSVF